MIEKTPQINLLPKELKEEKRQRQFIAQLFSFCLSLLFIFILWIVGIEAANQILAINLKTSESQIQQEGKELERMKTLEEKAKLLNETLKVVDDLTKQQVAWSQIIKDFSASVPASVQINNLSLNSKKSPNFSLSGKAASFRDILEFKEKLEASPNFKDIIFTSSNKVEGQGQSGYSFNLTFNLEGKK